MVVEIQVSTPAAKLGEDKKRDTGINDPRDSLRRQNQREYENDRQI